TWWPAFRQCFATCEPMKPAPPVTSEIMNCEWTVRSPRPSGHRRETERQGDVHARARRLIDAEDQLERLAALAAVGVGRSLAPQHPHHILVIGPVPRAIHRQGIRHLLQG